jgi:hypothetical protein
MARPYSEKFVLELYKADENKIGVQLAKICVKANLPTSHVAKTFGVSRMSIHSWFRGQYVREKNLEKILRFINRVTEAIEQGILPAMTTKQAKEFLDNLVIDKR